MKARAAAARDRRAAAAGGAEVTPLALAVPAAASSNRPSRCCAPDDEAILRGRAAFETMRVYGGRPFRLAEHSTGSRPRRPRVGLPPLDPAELEGLAATALAGAGASDAVLRLSGHRAGRRPTAGTRARRRRSRRTSSSCAGGASGSSRCSASAPAAVAAARGQVDELRRQHGRRGGGRAPWCRRRRLRRRTTGRVLEGPVTNVWWRRGETLFTPSLDLGMLAGVTRAAVLELAAGRGLRSSEGAFALERPASPPTRRSPPRRCAR